LGQDSVMSGARRRLKPDANRRDYQTGSTMVSADRT
jgi:hypothetical protein